MPDIANARTDLPCLPGINVGDWHILGDLMAASSQGNSGAIAWPQADLAIFVPVVIPRPITVKQLVWENGSVVSGNVDIGLFAFSGARLVSAGSTAQTGTSTAQFVDVTDTPIGIGYYFLGLVLNNTTGRIARWAPHSFWLQSSGVQQMATAFPLPDPVTFANPTNAYLPDVGIQFQAVA